MTSQVPPNVHISSHPCLQVKLSQLRSHSTTQRQTTELINEIATIVGCEALAKGLEVKQAGTDTTPLNYSYSTTTLTTASISVVPILRSGLSMVTPVAALLPFPVPVHHLGLYREKTTLQPVEYYNNLPYHRASAPQSGGATELAIILDPVIATGQTACAAIDTLRDWGVKRIIVLSVLGSIEGLTKAAESWPEGVEVWVGGADPGLDEKGMIKPGLGDVGDRLFLTLGK